MKNMNKKGQGAMEYLMTYGWAILVVLIVGIVLWQLGIFGGLGAGANKSVGYNVLAPLDRTIFFDATGDNLSYLLENRAGNALTIDVTQATAEVNVSGTCVYDSVGDVIIDGLNTGDVTIKAGETVNVTINDCTGLAAGDTFTVYVDITYTENVAGRVMTHQESGSLRGAAEV